MMREGTDTPLRLLPWTTPDGRPCYLSTDDADSRLSRMADEWETELLGSAAYVLDAAKSLFDEPGAGKGSCASPVYDWPRRWATRCGSR
jgi:hypothetical protein